MLSGTMQEKRRGEKRRGENEGGRRSREERKQRRRVNWKGGKGRNKDGKETRG